VPASHFSGLDALAPANSRWHAELRDGQHLVGMLRLDPDHEPQSIRTFEDVSQFSQNLAGLVEQVFAASRQLESRTHDHELLGAWNRSARQGSAVLASIRQLLRAGLQLTGFRSACLFLLNPAGDELRLRSTHPLATSEIPQPIRSLRSDPPDQQVLSSSTRIVLRRGDPNSEDWLPADASLGFCLPVVSHSGVLGTLWFFDVRHRAIAAREKQLLDSLSLQIGSLLERVVLEYESATHERLRHELLSLTETDFDSQIKTLQQPRLEAAWRVTSRFEIGGDLCEMTPLSPHEVAILIGDATGNSVPAAVVMTAAHGALAALLAGNHDEARDTSRVLGLVNRSLFHTRRLPHFMSLVFGVLDTQTRRFTYSNAGHPSPLLIRGGAAHSLDSRGMLLGIVDRSEYPAETIELRPRDVLVCYSDGISEARIADGQLFGRDGILQSLGSDPHQRDSVTLLNQIWNRQTAFAASGPPDDRSLLIVRVLSE
jgi:sigma-B regulation protein RsbU (phosphoserine phosphatase)